MGAYYPDVEERGSRKDTYNRVFLMGYRFDVLAYGYNKTSEDILHLRGLIAIREKTKDHWYRSSFKDEVGIGKLPAEVYPKVFRHDEGRSLTVALVDRRETKSVLTLTVDTAKLAIADLDKATLYTLDGKETPLEMSSLKRGELRITVPARQADPAAIVISK